MKRFKSAEVYLKAHEILSSLGAGSSLGLCWCISEACSELNGEDGCIYEFYEDNPYIKTFESYFKLSNKTGYYFEQKSLEATFNHRETALLLMIEIARDLEKLEKKRK